MSTVNLKLMACAARRMVAPGEPGHTYPYGQIRADSPDACERPRHDTGAKLPTQRHPVCAACVPAPASPRGFANEITTPKFVRLHAGDDMGRTTKRVLVSSVRDEKIPRRSTNPPGWSSQPLGRR